MKKLLPSLLVMCLIAISSFAQNARLTGKVLAKEDGLPLPGVSVKVVGTKIGTQTDANGSFSISVSPDAKILEISYIGFQTQNVSIGSNTNFNIFLVNDAKQLTEVVVTGTGVATAKTKLGIAVESITAADLPAVPSSSIDQALIGKVAGAQISSTNGTPGAPVNILLRGVSTP